MPYIDQNTPVIEQVELPSGSTYYIADRQIRNVVQGLSDTMAAGVQYNMAWNGTSAPTVANIPAGVVVTYNSTNYTGTLDADDATPGSIYLVKSSTLPSDDTSDIYDQYIPIGASGSKTWEKLGDTRLNLTDVVKTVTLDKKTASVIGASSTFKITQPTIALATDSQSATGRVSVVTDVSSAINDTSLVPAITSISPTSGSAITSVSAKTRYLETTTMYGVQSTQDTAHYVSEGTPETVINNFSSSNSNSDILQGVSVSNGVLHLGSVSPTTTTVQTFSLTSVNVPKLSTAGAVTVATGQLLNSGNVVNAGAEIAIDVNTGTGNFLNGLGTPTTRNAFSSGATIANTLNTTYIKATASGAKTEWNAKDAKTALISTTDVVVTTN